VSANAVRSAATTKPWRRVRRVVALLLLIVLLFPVALILPLRWLEPSTSAFMLEYRYLGGAGTRDYDYRWVDWNAVSPWAPLAMVSSEDQKFPLHNGFDVESIQDALASTGERMRGASTISQQTVKNLYLWSGRSFVRKGIEAWLTVYLEMLLPKKRILELYMNVAELGTGIYGVDAASRSYFRKPAAQLGSHEAALLAAVLPNPVSMSAGKPSAYVRRRAAWIERQMRALGGPHYLAQL
jgi:monofunctional biosynthetic peptidoglycan transglycosylase